MYDGICEAIHHELETLDEKYGSGAPITKAELESIDMMVHALKSMATYEAMTGEPYSWKRRNRESYRRY